MFLKYSQVFLLFFLMHLITLFSLFFKKIKISVQLLYINKISLKTHSQLAQNVQVEKDWQFSTLLSYFKHSTSVQFYGIFVISFFYTFSNIYSKNIYIFFIYLLGKILHFKVNVNADRNNRNWPMLTLKYVFSLKKNQFYSILFIVHKTLHVNVE